MKIFLTCTVADEVHTPVEFKIPANMEVDVMKILRPGVGVFENRAIQEIPFDIACDVAALVGLDIAPMRDGARAWCDDR